MPERPYTLLSCGMSIDGYIDTATDERLVLSNNADLDRVDAVRADSDAILVGAATLRNDNPRLLVRAPSRRAERITRGLPPTPIKVTVTSRAELDPCAAFFVTGDTEKLVCCPTDAVAEARCRLGAVATVVDGGRPIEMCRIGEDLRARGVRRLIVEGAGRSSPSSSRPALRTSCTWCWRLSSWATPGAAVRLRWKLPVEPRPPCGAGGGTPVRRRRTPALRALGPFRPGLKESTMHLPAATIRTQVMVPLRFADGFGTTARVYTVDGRTAGSISPSASPAAVSADPEVPAAGPDPQRVLHRRRPRERAVRLGRSCSRRSAASRRLGRSLLYPRREDRGIGLYARLDAYGLQDAALDTYDANLALGYSEDGRHYTVAAQMLGALGLDRVALLSNNPGKAAQLDRSHRRGAGVDRGAPQRDQRSLPGHDGRQRRTHAGPPVR
jgi:riboflavin biosynthesis pyrimidine reductase